jgi:hypothetical protein
LNIGAKQHEAVSHFLGFNREMEQMGHKKPYFGMCYFCLNSGLQWEAQNTTTLIGGLFKS